MKIHYLMSLAAAFILYSPLAGAECIPFDTTRAWVTPNQMQQEEAFCSAMSEAACRVNKASAGDSFYCGWRESAVKQAQAAAIANPPVAQSDSPSDSTCKNFDQKKFDYLTKEAKSNSGKLCSEANSKQNFGPAEKNLYVAMAKVSACGDFQVSKMAITQTYLERGFVLSNPCESIDLSDANATIGGGTVEVHFKDTKSQELHFDSHYNIVGPPRSVDFWYQQLTGQIIGGQDVEMAQKLNKLVRGVGSVPSDARLEGNYSSKNVNDGNATQGTNENSSSIRGN